jgi:hypothetical protein
MSGTIAAPRIQWNAVVFDDRDGAHLAERYTCHALRGASTRWAD